MRFRTLEEIRRHLSSQRSSGLSVSAYCKREGVSQNTFFNWRKRERDTQPSPISFLQLPAQSAQPQKFEITLPNGSRLTMPLSCDTAFLRQTHSHAVRPSAAIAIHVHVAFFRAGVRLLAADRSAQEF